MELRTYWNIIWRRIWLVILIVGVVALYVGYQYYHLAKTPGALKAYSSQVVIQIGLQPISNEQDTSYADKESVSDTLAETLITSPILSSKEFDTQVVNQIQSDMGQITQKYGPNPDLGDWQNVGAIGNALSSSRAHTIVTLNVTWNTSAGAWAIANAFGEVSSANICTYLSYVVPKGSSCSSANNTRLPIVSARVLTTATDAVVVPGPSASKINLFVILIFVALIIGLALTFLADYFDDRIRGKDDAAQLLQLPIYGEVPRAPALGRTKAPATPSSVT